MIRLMTVALLLALAACTAAGPVVPQEQAAQFQQASGYPYNSFYCP
jgi:predicted small lipoprotein YifL